MHGRRGLTPFSSIVLETVHMVVEILRDVMERWGTCLTQGMPELVQVQVYIALIGALTCARRVDKNI